MPVYARDAAPDSVYAAHAVSVNAGSGGLPCLRRGTLILIGGGEMQDDHKKRFLELAGGKAAKVVAIPTAHVDPNSPFDLNLYGEVMANTLGVPHVTVLHTFSRKDADAEELVKSLRSATGVWIDGGEGTYLLDAYMGTRVERELIALLDRGGVIAGSSAGALIWGSRSMVFRTPAGSAIRSLQAEDLLVGQAHEPCLGVLRNVLVAPHFTESNTQAVLGRMIRAYPKLVALGIDELTALEVHDDRCTVLGRGSVSVFRGNDGKPLFELKDGERFDLRAVKKL